MAGKVGNKITKLEPVNSHKAAEDKWRLRIIFFVVYSEILAGITSTQTHRQPPRHSQHEADYSQDLTKPSLSTCVYTIPILMRGRNRMPLYTRNPRRLRMRKPRGRCARHRPIQPRSHIEVMQGHCTWVHTRLVKQKYESGNRAVVELVQ